jgi:hypothetical protein
MPIQPEEGSNNLCELEHRSKPRQRAIHAADRRTLGRESGSVNLRFHSETPSKCLVNVAPGDVVFTRG